MGSGMRRDRKSSRTHTVRKKKKNSHTKTEILLYPDVDLVIIIYVTDPGIPPVFQQQSVFGDVSTCGGLFIVFNSN